MGTVNTSERLARLRQLMQERKVDVYSMISDSPFPNVFFLVIVEWVMFLPVFALKSRSVRR